MNAQKTSGPEKLREWCRARLSAHEESALQDPLASGVRMLAVDLWEKIERGSLGADDIDAAAKAISDDALTERANRLGRRSSPGDWNRVVAEALAPLAGKPFAEVAAALAQTRAGVVFTAHPTFALNRKARQAIGALASGRDVDLGSVTHSPDRPITLLDEHEDVQAAIARAQESARRLFAACFEWLRAHYPDDWTSAEPATLSLASWVGYDLDGRTDISWSATIRIRLEEKALQLFRYAQALAAIRGGEDLAAELAEAAEEAAHQAQLFAGALDDPAEIVAAANRMTENRPGRLTSLDEARRRITKLVEGASDDEKLALCVLRSEMTAFGLGVARIHLRVNAAQIRSALRLDLGLDPTRDFLNRTVLDEAAAKSAGVSARHINFGNVVGEKMTARRQLMLCAQILKHVDADTPIRFLIAEIEAPATIMGAIYLARLYGVDHRIDISPLFETPEAIERGGRFVERLLEEKEFVSYIRRRGRISIQCGFSDSGRFMGQIAADLGIERLHILLSRALAAKNITDIEVVVFNTHGESMGRGAHPASFDARFNHLMTPWTRARYAHDGLSLNAECSFQGGDGFLYFETQRLADATTQALFKWGRRVEEKDLADRYYADINYSWDVYRAFKGWQETLFANAHYQKVLSALSQNLLPVTGSRKARRQSGATKDDISKSLRAIPHNAILQQLAAPANVLGGLGAAARPEQDRFVALVRNSPRVRALFSMASSARRLTSLSILRSYASLYDPGFWTVRAARMADATSKPAALRVAEALAQRNLDIDLNRLANHLSVDRQDFDAVCRDLNLENCQDAFSSELYILHAIRIALVAQGFALVASIPPFSPRHEVTRETLIDRAFDLRFAEIGEQLEEIFPDSEAQPEIFSTLGEEGDREEIGGYPEIRERIAAPLKLLDQRIHAIAVGISHFYDAFG